jgi:hypothetical protein
VPRWWQDNGVKTQWLDEYQPADEAEAADVERVRQLVANGGDAWSRDTPLHLTASALVVDPASGKVLRRRRRGWATSRRGRTRGSTTS